MQPQPIFGRAFWKQFRIELVRFRRDPRARKSVVRRIWLIVILTGWIFYEAALVHSLHDPATEVGMLALLFAILGVMGAVRFSQWRESQRQLATDIASVPKETTAHVQRHAYGLAAMIERALGERWLKSNVVPDGHMVITRSIQIEALRKHGVWDEMPVSARTAMMEPDGAWTEDRIRSVLVTGEKLNSLLWALSLQSSLRPVEELLTVLSMKNLSQALQSAAPGIRPPWDIRPERNRAYEYFWRCYAERVHRGDLSAESESQATAVAAWIKEIDSNPQGDYLAGASTIGEIDIHAVRTAGSHSIQRAIILDRLMDLLDGKDVWGELTEFVYGPLLEREEVVYARADAAARSEA